jgi:ketosteroid isomerase-like protein
MKHDQAAQFARDWYAAWASHDAHQILSLYADDVEFISPSVVLVNQDVGGVIHGKAALADYLSKVLDRFPDLKFQPIALMLGVNSIAMHYRGVWDHLVVEVVSLREGKISTSNTHYSIAEKRESSA